jgi:CTP:molybdopterin cytidylyltransferase MocA
VSTNGAVILAAGAGSRMGLPKWRLVAGGTSFLDRAVLTCIEAGVPHVVVVASPADEASMREAAGDLFAVVVNPAPGATMFSSLLVGLGALGPRVDRLVVLPVDCPAVTVSTVRTLLAASLVAPHHFVVPHYRGLPGHPVVYPAAMFPALATWSGEDGARGLLAAHAHFVEKIDVNDAEVLTDIDEPADYDALVARLERSAR